MKQPYAQEGDQFVAGLAEQKSDIKELAGLRAGLWLYYEGISGGWVDRWWVHRLWGGKEGVGGAGGAGWHKGQEAEQCCWDTRCV